MFSFGSSYRSLPVTTGEHKLTAFSFGSCYRLLPVATGGHKLTMFFLVAAKGHYQPLQVETS